jgi:hypothetical protein
METIHFFRAGTHVASNGKTLAFSEKDLKSAAVAYDPRTHEAPLVVGHPKNDDPAFGWVERVIAKPDGLHAVPKQVNPEFAEQVRSGSYKKVSASFYLPNSANNPKPGTLYLKHIGFLGAQPPAVKGLSAIQFAEGEDVFFMEEDVVTLREHSLNARERALGRRDLEETIKRAQKEGRIPIGLMRGVVTFAESLSTEATLDFSEEGDKPAFSSPSGWFMDFVSKLPTPVHTGEICAGDFGEADGEFVAPSGYTADPQSAALDNLARAHIKQHGGSYAQAVMAVAGSPTLKG